MLVCWTLLTTPGRPGDPQTQSAFEVAHRHGRGTPGRPGGPHVEKPSPRGQEDPGLRPCPATCCCSGPQSGHGERAEVRGTGPHVPLCPHVGLALLTGVRRASQVLLPLTVWHLQAGCLCADVPGGGGSARTGRPCRGGETPLPSRLRAHRPRAALPGRLLTGEQVRSRPVGQGGAPFPPPHPDQASGPERETLPVILEEPSGNSLLSLPSPSSCAGDNVRPPGPLGGGGGHPGSR